jgi:glycerophosphoryl diester phosphodiesterase
VLILVKLFQFFSRFIAIFLVGILFVLQGCNSEHETSSCLDSLPAVTPETLFFDGVRQPISITADKGNLLAVACHNCYSEISPDAAVTNNIIEAAIMSHADVIELDVVLPEGRYAMPLVSHGMEENSILLEKVISAEVLRDAAQILFIEIKGELNRKQQVRDLLNLLKVQYNHFGELAYFNSSRFTVLRNIQGYKSLALIRDTLTELAYSDIQPFVKLSQLHTVKSETLITTEIKQAYQCGFHMVELNTQIGTNAIRSLASFAKSLGLGINVFTLHEDNFLDVVENLKDDVDIITIDEFDDFFTHSEKKSIFFIVKELIEN